MGIDLSQIFGDAKQSAETGMSDLWKMGSEAALGYAEKQGVAVLQADQAQHQANYQAAATTALNRPSSPFGEYVKSLTQNPIIKQYGVYILAGIAVVAIVAVSLKGR